MKVKGLTISDILDIDLDQFNRLGESDLRHITSRLVSASNKRIRRLEKNNLNTPAYQQLGEAKAFSTKLPKSISRQQRVNRLRNEFARARSFLTSETSTMKGYKDFVDRTESRLASELGIPKSDVHSKLDVNRLFDVLHEAQKQGLVNAYRGSKGSLQARNAITDKLMENPDIDPDELMTWIRERMDEYYEDQEKNDIEEDQEDENGFDIDDW